MIWIYESKFSYEIDVYWQKNELFILYDGYYKNEIFWLIWENNYQENSKISYWFLTTCEIKFYNNNVIKNPNNLRICQQVSF